MSDIKTEKIQKSLSNYSSEEVLYLKQKHTLKLFLQKRAISEEEYEKNLELLTQSMKMDYLKDINYEDIDSLYGEIKEETPEYNETLEQINRNFDPNIGLSDENVQEFLKQIK